MRTMKAHTRLDLNTSSLIWEYCAVRRRRRTDRKGGGKKGDEEKMEKRVFRQTEKTLRCSSITPNRRFNGSTTSVRERQEPGGGGQAEGPGEGAKLTSTMLAVSC